MLKLFSTEKIIITPPQDITLHTGTSENNKYWWSKYNSTFTERPVSFNPQTVIPDNSHDINKLLEGLFTFNGNNINHEGYAAHNDT